MKIWIFEDDAEISKQWVEAIIGEYPECEIKCFKSLLEALDVAGGPDIVLIDVAALTAGDFSLMGGCDSKYLLGAFFKRHSSPIYLMYSMVGHWAEDCIKDVKERFPEIVIEQFDPLGLKSLLGKLEQYFPKGEMLKVIKK